jgi:hypothetical protein
VSDTFEAGFAKSQYFRGFHKISRCERLELGDLKPQPSGLSPGNLDVRRQAGVCPGDGVCAVAHVPSSGAEVTRRLQRAHLQLSGSILEHGVRADHFPREPAGHRRHASKRTQPRPIIWVCAATSLAATWPTPTSDATGASRRRMISASPQTPRIFPLAASSTGCAVVWRS